LSPNVNSKGNVGFSYRAASIGGGFPRVPDKIAAGTLSGRFGRTVTYNAGVTCCPSVVDCITIETSGANVTEPWRIDIMFSSSALAALGKRKAVPPPVIVKPVVVDATAVAVIAFHHCKQSRRRLKAPVTSLLAGEEEIIDGDDNGGILLLLVGVSPSTCGTERPNTPSLQNKKSPRYNSWNNQHVKDLILLNT
jgi:hypothetical protein